MDEKLVSGDQWSQVKAYADTHGYSFVDAGSAKDPTHPIQTVDWFDAVKWCNARSEQEGLTPVYYTDAAFTMVYRTGEVTANWKPDANGYRLPTEAEWEKAARGGLVHNRFPLGDAIQDGPPGSGGQANYSGNTSYGYDLGPNGYNSAYNNGSRPYTSPAGSFPPNGYSLQDMMGDVFEWCWDWYAPAYYAATQTDPHGPTAGAQRVFRGGAWDSEANVGRCAYRNSGDPTTAGDNLGFRCVRGNF
jgi:formylglycine-generating enzyme required for sulfatase activity